MKLGFGIYTAPSEGLSYMIKIFTWYAIRPEVRKFFGLKSVHDCPTHSIVYGEKTEDQYLLLLESNKTNELNYDAHKYGNTPRMMKFSYIIKGEHTRDNEIFRDLVKTRGNLFYAVWQWLNFIRRGLWWWIFRRDIKNSKQWFSLWDVCSELVARDMKTHAVKYILNTVRRGLNEINFNVVAPADLLNIIYDAIQAKEIAWEK